MIRLDCYLPERADEAWARLRHLGARRFAQVADVTSCMQQAGDLLGCAWPAPLAAAARPLESVSWLAGMAVITGRCCGQPARLRKMGYEKFLAAVRRELPRWGGKYVRHSIVAGLWEALADTGGVAAQRPRRAGAAAPAAGGLAGAARPAGRHRGPDDRAAGRAGPDRAGDQHRRAVGAVGGAVILAETGDLSRFASGRAVVKHAGLNPSEHTLGDHDGQTRISRRGRPGAAVRGLARGLGRAAPQPGAARQVRAPGPAGTATGSPTGRPAAACAATLLRWLWAVITTRQPWDARIAAGRSPPAPRRRRDLRGGRVR